MAQQSFGNPHGAGDARKRIVSTVRPDGTWSTVHVMPGDTVGTETYQRSALAADPDRTVTGQPVTARPSFSGPRAIRQGPRTVQASRRDTITYHVRPFESFDQTVRSIASMVPADRDAAMRAVAAHWARECESMLTRTERNHYAVRLTAEHPHLGELPKSQRIRTWLTDQLLPIVRQHGRTSGRVPAGWDLSLRSAADPDRSRRREGMTLAESDAADAAQSAHADTVTAESPERIAYRLHVNGADHTVAHCALCV